MQALIFEVGGESFAVPAALVLRVVRRPGMRAVPGAPAWIAGLFAWEGEWVPVVDLCHLISGEPCPPGAASRVALVERTNRTATRVVGLLAPGMTRVEEIAEAKVAPGLRLEGKGFLGPIALEDEAGVQLLDAASVLPPELDALLFFDERAAGAPG